MIADVLVALADPTRRRIFELVAERPRPVGQLAAELPVSRPAVSQHLRVLRDAGLVAEDRIGSRHLHRLDPAGLGLVRAYFESFWDRSLASFKQAAEQAGAGAGAASSESAAQRSPWSSRASRP